MDPKSIIVIGASAGGLDALRTLVEGLPEDLPAALFIVQHVHATGDSLLPSLLNRVSDLPISRAHNGELIEAGHIYVAPPNRHLTLMQPGVTVLSGGAKENGHRPAIDPLFRSAARTYGRRVIGIILTGTLDDGAAGLLAVKMREGIAIVQDPEDALYPEMPQNAINQVEEIDYIVPVREMPAMLVELVNRINGHNVPEGHNGQEDVYQLPDQELPDQNRYEVDVNPIVNPPEGAWNLYEGSASLPNQTVTDQLQSPLLLICPDCGGALWEHQAGKAVQFRCHTGHVYSMQSLHAAQNGAVEEALWSAFRALEERAALTENMAARMRRIGQSSVTAEEYEEQARAAHEHAKILRSLIDAYVRDSAPE